jgi:hypothetical protein
MKPTTFRSKTTPWRVQVPGRYFANRKRTTKYFATRQAAEEFMQKLKKFGTALFQEQPASLAEKKHYGILVDHALAELGGDPDRLFEAIKHFKATKLNLMPATAREAVEQFQAIRKTRVDASTWDADRWRLLKFVRAFERHQISEITEADLRRFFDSVRGHIRSIYKTVRVFFKWAKDYNFIGINPMINISPVGEFGVRKDIYPVETFQRMLRVAASLEPVRPGVLPTRDFIALLPWFALSGFCGLRSCEAFRLARNSDAIRWKDLYFDRGFIEIRNEVAKATRRDDDQRHIETAHYLEATKAWLDLLPAPEDQNAFVVPWTKRKMKDLRAAFQEATGIQLLENGLRNSFASYALTFNGLAGVGKLALEMGNSEGVCKRFYVKTLLPGSGRAWFNLRPAIGNVIAMPVGAVA